MQSELLACFLKGVQDPPHKEINLQHGVPVGPMATLALELFLHYEGGVGLCQGIIGQPWGGLAAGVLDVVKHLLVDDAGGSGGAS